MKKIFIFLFVFTLLFLTASPCAFAADYSATSGIELNCKIDYMISLDDGSVIFDKNSNTHAAPASMTKVTTALVVLQNCKDLNEVITVKKEVLDTLANTGSSLSGIKAGEEITVLNLLYCLLVPSGNDAAAVLADYIGKGSIQSFVDMMNKTVKDLGCKDTHYDNPHGLDSKTHYTSAHDLAIIAKAALEYNTFKKIVATSSYNLPRTNMNPERRLINTNHILNKSYVTYYRDFVKGIKTGHTDEAGHCVVTYASRNGYNYLAVTMGGDYRDSDNDRIPENQAFMDSIRMYEWAFEKLSYELVASADVPVAEVKVNYSWKTDHMRLVPKDDLRKLVPTGTDEGSILIEPIDKPGSVNAPIKAGQTICKASVKYADNEIAKIDLVFPESVSRNYLLYFGGLLKKLFSYAVVKILTVLIIACVIVFLIYRSRSIKPGKPSGSNLKIVKMNTSKGNKQDKNYKPKH